MTAKASLRSSFELFVSLMESVRFNKPFDKEVDQAMRMAWKNYLLKGIPIEKTLGFYPAELGSRMTARRAYQYWLRGEMLFKAWKACNSVSFDSAEFLRLVAFLKKMKILVGSSIAEETAFDAVSKEMGLSPNQEFKRCILAAFMCEVGMPTTKQRLQELLTAHGDETSSNTYADMLSRSDLETIENE